MKCNWLGKKIVSGDAGQARYSLVILTPKTLDYRMKTTISGLSGIMPLENILKFHADGFFILAQADNAASLGVIAKGLKAIGISSLIFNDSKIFDVPELAEPSTCRIDGDKLVFLPKSGGDVTIFGKYARLLVVHSQIEETPQHGSAQAPNAPFQTMAPPASYFSSKKSENSTISVAAVYDMIGAAAVKIREGSFNFKDLLKDKTQPDFKSNFISLLTEADSVVSRINVDTSFKTSSLPLAEAEKSVSRSGSGFFSQAGNRVSSSEMNVFEQYSRFRYIAEQRLNSE
ncbi:MAG: hypothetical protein WCX65_05390 [bacterium]